MVGADSLFWPFTQRGEYSCESGYRFLKEENEIGLVDNQAEDEKALWKGNWSLHLPNKVKIFMWRACRELLPSKANLVRRNIIDCPVGDWC